MRANRWLNRVSTAWLRGRHEEARAMLEEIARDDSAEEMWVIQQSARWVQACLAGDPEALCGVSETMAARDIVPSPGLVAVWLPGFYEIVWSCGEKPL